MNEPGTVAATDGRPGEVEDRDATAPAVTIAIPTYRRPAALATTLATLVGQTEPRFAIVVSDQTEAYDVAERPPVDAVLRLLRVRGHDVAVRKHLPRQGLAEQRDFLLRQVRSPYVLFLDDDVLLEPDLIARLRATIERERCGFVGSALIGLSFLGDERPHEEAVELWEGPVAPERVLPGSRAWARHRLHNAANVFHLQRRLGLDPEHQRLYKIAWVGGCVLYDVEKLRAAGGFSFWHRLPRSHAGEDVLAQLSVMERFGGAAVLPSGAYHQELPTTVPDRRVDAALQLAGGRPR